MDWKKLALEQAALVKQLQARNVELEARIAVLEKNSSNSSKPPPSDIVKPPRKSTSKDTKRKRGSQKGHKQHLRKPFEENQVVTLDLASCPTCGGKLVPSNHPPKVHQQVELVDKPFVVTEYRQGWYWCERCRCCHAAEWPKEIEKSGLFGPKLISLTCEQWGTNVMSFLKSCVESFLHGLAPPSLLDG